MSELLPVLDVPTRVLMATPMLFLLFTVICFWVLQGRRKKIYQRLQNFPLND